MFSFTFNYLKSSGKFHNIWCVVFVVKYLELQYSFKKHCELTTPTGLPVGVVSLMTECNVLLLNLNKTLEKSTYYSIIYSKVEIPYQYGSYRHKCRALKYGREKTFLLFSIEKSSRTYLEDFLFPYTKSLKQFIK